MDLFDGRYEKIAPIGRGAFAEVWQATDTQTGVTLALKIFTIDKDLDEEGMKMLTREFALMIDADHRNLLRPLYFGISHDDSRQPYLTMPFCKNGNINKMIGKLTEREAWKLIRDTASALTYLHAMEPPIIHQDIKPANILIGNDGYYKLSDFGVSIRAKSTLSSMAASEMAFSSAGTISYMAPEKFSRDTRPIMANDIWSLGAMVYEMIDGDLPFGNDGGLLQKKGADIPLLHSEFSERLKQTLDDCLNPEPWNRPMASKLEEIAIDALSKAPTVKMMAEEPKAVESPQKEAPAQNPSIEPKRRGLSIKSFFLVLTTVLIIIIGVSVYFLMKPAATNEEKTVIVVNPVVEENPAAEENPAEEKYVPIHETNPEKPSATSLSEDSKPKTVLQEQKPKVQEPKVQEPQKQKPQKGNLSYGQWVGTVSGGKPVGFGTLSFTSATSIHCTNGSIISPQAGDKITNAEFDDNGYLYQGKWIKSNGESKNIMP